MTHSLMDAFGTSAGGGFYDDAEEVPMNNGGEPKSNRGLQMEVVINTSKKNPFDDIKFSEEEDPDNYMQSYEQMKKHIKVIDKNTKHIERLCENYNNSTTKEVNDEIMRELDKIMSNNSHITNKIKKQLKIEKINNDEFIKKNASSSIGQWRINQLNTCTRKFKTSALDFSRQLNAFNATLRQKQRRHIDILDDGKLSEQEKDEMVMDYDRANQFIEDQLTLVDTSDELIHRLREIELRHEGMMKIEKSMKELQQLWQELGTLITEQQEMLDNITYNVTQTLEYVQSATHNLEKAEEHQKCTRKMQLLVCCCCIVILVIIMFSVFGQDMFGGA